MTCWAARCRSPTTCRIRRSPTRRPPGSCRRSTTASTARPSPPPISTAAPSTPPWTCWAARCSRSGATGHHPHHHLRRRRPHHHQVGHPRRCHQRRSDPHHHLRQRQPARHRRNATTATAPPTRPRRTSFDGLGRVTSQTVRRSHPRVLLPRCRRRLHRPRPPPRRTRRFPGDPLDLTSTIALGGQQTSSARASTRRRPRRGDPADLRRRPGGSPPPPTRTVAPPATPTTPTGRSPPAPPRPAPSSPTPTTPPPAG